MTKVHLYLNFNGNCEEAFNFYQKIFKTEFKGIYRMSEMPPHPDYPIAEEDKNKIMHIALPLNDGNLLMGSDCLESYGQHTTPGNNTYIMLDAENTDEARRLYAELTAGSSKIEMELGPQFWAELYASFEDQYGIKWMVHYEGNANMN